MLNYSFKPGYSGSTKYWPDTVGGRIQWVIRQSLNPGQNQLYPYQNANRKSVSWLIYQPNKSFGRPGEARQSGNIAVAAELAVLALHLGCEPLLLGSTWSSFSELAQRMSKQRMTIEMSGKDF